MMKRVQLVYLDIELFRIFFLKKTPKACNYLWKFRKNSHQLFLNFHK